MKELKKENRKMKELKKENRKRLGKIDIEEKDLSLSEMKSLTKKIDLSKLKKRILDKLLDEKKVQFYLLFDIIEEFCGDDFIVNNFLKLISEVDDKEFLNNLNKYIDKKIKENAKNT